MHAGTKQACARTQLVHCTTRGSLLTRHAHAPGATGQWRTLTSLLWGTQKRAPGPPRPPRCPPQPHHHQQLPAVLMLVLVLVLLVLLVLHPSPNCRTHPPVDSSTTSCPHGRGRHLRCWLGAQESAGTRAEGSAMRMEEPSTCQLRQTGGDVNRGALPWGCYTIRRSDAYTHTRATQQQVGWLSGERRPTQGVVTV
jgi:hypothetical protein